MFFIIIIVLVVTLLVLFPVKVISGSSMFPTFKDNQIIICTKIFSRKNLKEGKVYVYKSPSGKLVIKRLSQVERVSFGTYYYFLGDNPAESYDSRNYGYIAEKDIVAKVCGK